MAFGQNLRVLWLRRHHERSEVTQGGATEEVVVPPGWLRSARNDGGAEATERWLQT